MKKISYYLTLIVIVGAVFVSFWTYQKYFKKEELKFLSFKVERGAIQEIVRVRGEVVPQKDFNLEFPFSGIVEKIFVKEGQEVVSGEPLIKLETTDFELEIQKLQAQLAGAEANLKSQQAKLDELKKGTRPEEIKIQEVKVANAQTVVSDAKNSAIDDLRDAYIKSDDAVHNKVDQFFNNPKSQNPTLSFSMVDPQLKTDLEWGRLTIESMFPEWKTSLEKLSASSDIALSINEGKRNLNQIDSFLNKAASAVNSLLASSGASQASIDAWKLAVATARTNVSTSIISITDVEQTLATANSNLSVEENNLILKKAGTVLEQITGQEAQVKQAEANIQNYQAQIAIVQEKIKKSTLYAPTTAKIAKIWFERGEFFKPDQSAITLETSGHKIQADISELEIGKVRETDGNQVLIKLDAFPNLELKGKIISIEPKEIIKEDDKYYRVNVYIEPHDPEVRSGMNADLVILISFKASVLKIPELAIYQKENKKIATVLEGSGQKEIEIKTGISDGESIEITSGLEEGQIVVVSAD